jgi:hypothetical protein
MIRNESNSDSLTRVAFGLALLSLFFIGPKSAWGLLGVIPLITGLIGWCPVYHLLGWSTCRTPRSEH